MKNVVACLALASAALAHAQSLSDFEARIPKNQNDYPALMKFAQEVGKWIETNKLTSAEDFRRAAKLTPANLNDFRTRRVPYELLLVAAAKDDREAEKLLPDAWDSLLASLGRPIRIDRNGWVAKMHNPDFMQLDPAPPCIQAILRNPDQSRKSAGNAKDNAEMKKIVDDDQSVRQNFSNLTEDQLKAMMAADHQRNVRTREIVLAGDLHTANDFANASLVMQHSAAFLGYELAHELAVCSMLLGDRKSGRWLIAATYDRMLNSVGHDQRFGTQYSMEGHKRTDETAI
jgi:hypothetical protein